MQFAVPAITEEGIVLSITGVPDGDYGVEISSDLKTWAPIREILNPDAEGRVTFTDSTSPGAQEQFFYRLRRW